MRSAEPAKGDGTRFTASPFVRVMSLTRKAKIMLRITTLVLAGALVAGCQGSDVQQLTAHHGGVQGDKSYGNEVQGSVAYRDDHVVYGDPRYTNARVSGDKSFGNDQNIARTDVTRT